MKMGCIRIGSFFKKLLREGDVVVFDGELERVLFIGPGILCKQHLDSQGTLLVAAGVVEQTMPGIRLD
jgi:hypothetical protein